MVLICWSCDRSNPPKGEPVRETSTSAVEPVASASTPEVAALPSDVWRGVCFAHSWERGGVRGYGSEASAEALDHLSGVGVDWISITPFGFMPDLNTPAIRGEHNADTPRGAESRVRLEAVVRQARERDMKVMLKPHIWIRGGKWRGRIKPLNEDGELAWDAWWDSHDAWILYYAELSQALEVESLVIGLELHTAVQAQPERLIALADKVRAVYDGHITYSANWNEPVPKSVWRAIDSVGVQFYPPLVDERDSRSIVEMKTSVREHLSDWSAVADDVARPLVITEVGYRSADLAVRHPNAWPEKHTADLDHELQATAYRVLFDAIAETPSVRGIFLWKYFTDRTTDEEGPTGFSPRGKPAEDVIRRAFQETIEPANDPT